MKYCPRCKQEKPQDNFHVRKASKDGLSCYCKRCTQQYKKDNPEAFRNATLKYRLGITLEQYEGQFRLQGGVCAICKTHTTKHRLHTDHDHLTGQFRGLLCGRCNQALGLFKDNLNTLNSAIEYLKKQRS